VDSRSTLLQRWQARDDRDALDLLLRHELVDRLRERRAVVPELGAEAGARELSDE
jgi:hypothetical protein